MRFDESDLGAEDAQEIRELARQVNDLMPQVAVKLIHFVKDFSSSDITIAQAFLLRNLAEHGACTASTIGDFMGITSGPVTSLTKRLMAKGLLKRQQDEEDGRVYWFSLTPEGHDLVAQFSEYRQAQWAYLLSQLGVERSRDVVLLLEDAKTILSQMEGGRDSQV